MTQSVEISLSHAKKLEEIMEFISDSGAEPITRSTSAEICIDWTYGIIKENMNKVNLEGISFHKEKDIQGALIVIDDLLPWIEGRKAYYEGTSDGASLMYCEGRVVAYKDIIAEIHSRCFDLKYKQFSNTRKLIRADRLCLWLGIKEETYSYPGSRDRLYCEGQEMAFHEVSLKIKERVFDFQTT
ncbi:hypothetical protein [Paenibacillus sp. FSL P4-0288]|uniref:hypothetical protein n=1 Tax=Paenibacillus sp. FSL P4-0288 TaxID=2921633 RepID=UPI0030FA3BFA